MEKRLSVGRTDFLLSNLWGRGSMVYLIDLSYGKNYFRFAVFNFGIEIWFNQVRTITMYENLEDALMEE
jgi:hypothetical protein